MPEGQEGAAGTGGDQQQQQQAGGTGQGAGGGDPWYKGATPEVVGHLQARGWETKTPTEVALEAVRAHFEAQKFIGAPPDQIVRMPKDASDEAGWSALRSRLGVPADAAGYKFDDVKRADGSALDESQRAFLAQTALSAHLAPDAAVEVAKAFTKFQDDAASRTAADNTAKLAEAKATLQKNWGVNHEANLFIARQAAAALGVTPEQVNALENVAGYDKVMEMFRSIGTKIGEDKFVQNLNPNQAGVMTREQAMAKKQELMNDSTWTKAYLNGDSVKVREMTALNTIIVG